MIFKNFYFAEDEDWKKMYNRWLDSGEFSKEETERLKSIQLSIFKNVMKEIDKEEQDSFNGSREHNRIGDFKVAVSIKKSFRNFEANKKKEKSYFKF